jgi:addiction module RelE/StbE family toxin
VEIVWTRNALYDLQHLHAYIRQRNPAAASRVAQRIKETIRTLATSPYGGRQGRVFGTRELIIPGTRYIAAYQVQPSRVLILRIIHHARNWEDAFEAS